MHYKTRNSDTPKLSPPRSQSLSPSPLPSSSQLQSDYRMMAVAIGLAERHIGMTGPNPSVGCVICQNYPDNEGNINLPDNLGMPKIIASAVTGKGGRPHAETQALAVAGNQAWGATAYVTLEPCCHVGVTPPCTEALINADIKRVVIGRIDPDPRMDGGGVARLRQAGINVTELVLPPDLARRCHEVVAGFAMRIQQNRPLIAVKIASSLDGRIATQAGDSKWITGNAARQRGHLLRARHDAIMIGSETALQDDPILDCRLPGLHDASPVRIILDGRLRLPITAKIFANCQEIPTWLFTDAANFQQNSDDPNHTADYSNNSEKIEFLQKTGVKIMTVGRDQQGKLSLTEILRQMANKGINSVLVEGGSQLIASIMRQNLLDRLYWFRAPIIIGGDGIAAMAHENEMKLADLPRLSLMGEEYFASDLYSYVLDNQKITQKSLVEKLEIYQVLR